MHSSFASTMCVANNTVAVVLDPTINGTTYAPDLVTQTWVTTFPYGTISGVALCSSTSGPASNDNIGTPDETGDGRYCWCRIQHPVKSAWFFVMDRGTLESCESNCAGICGIRIRDTAKIRRVSFGSVAQ